MILRFRTEPSQRNAARQHTCVEKALRRSFIAVFVITLCSQAAWTQIPSTRSDPTAGSAETARNLFLNRCSSCHGEKANGAGPWHTILVPQPANLTLVADAKEMMYSIVLNGIPGTMMPAHPDISRQLFEGLHDYIKSQPQDMSSQWDHPWWTRQKFDAENGRQHFITSCAGCHGLEGKGNGEFAADPHVWPKPANFTGRNSDVGRLYHVITEGRPGTMMPPQKDKLPEAVRWELATYVAGLLQSDSRETIQSANGQIPRYVNRYYEGDSQTAREGKLQYNKVCGPCHGQDGKGLMTGTQFEDREWFVAAHDSATITTGKERFDLWCAPCHGGEGKGSFLAPRLIDRKWYFGGGTDNAIFTVLDQGVPGKLMPSFKELSEDERWKVVTFLRSQGGLSDPSVVLQEKEFKALHEGQTEVKESKE